MLFYEVSAKSGGNVRDAFVTIMKKARTFACAHTGPNILVAQRCQINLRLRAELKYSQLARLYDELDGRDARIAELESLIERQSHLTEEDGRDARIAELESAMKEAIQTLMNGLHLAEWK
jgi:hypothetical protein